MHIFSFRITDKILQSWLNFIHRPPILPELEQYGTSKQLSHIL